MSAVSPKVDFQELCESDLDSLTSVPQYIKTQDAAQNEYQHTTSRTYSGGLTGLSGGGLTAGLKGSVTATRSVSMSGIKLSHVTDAGEEAVSSGIGAKCRALIASWTKKGHLVVLISAATIADKLDVTVTYDKSLNPSLALKIAKDFAPGVDFSVGGKDTVTAKYKNAVIEIRPGTI